MPLNFTACRDTFVLLAACALAAGAAAQGAAPGNTASPACPPAASYKAPQVYGLWTARFTAPPDGLPAAATLLLQQHAEFSASLSGFVSRDLGVAAGTPKIAGHAARALLAGDLEDGILVLDESSDNTSITGIWNGEVVAESCGQQIRGVWKDTSKSAPPDAPEVPFLLTRRPG
ncbi:MAG: hypothetical protein Q7T87_03915 [Polaromonas sp.]|nr:hypothetical protein [Polaromonas sp.]